MDPYRDISTAFATAVRRAKISDFTFHDLRHCFASRLVMAGVDLTTVKELMGHKHIAMTLRYAHLAPGHKRAAIAMLDRHQEKVPAIFTTDKERRAGQPYKLLKNNTEASRCWCAAWTSNPVVGANPFDGGFDSHTLPPHFSGI